MKNSHSEPLREIDKLLIDAAVMIIKSDLTSQESKEDSKKYLKDKYAMSSKAEQEYILEKFGDPLNETTN